MTLPHFLRRPTGRVPHALSSTNCLVRAAKSVPQPDQTHTSSRYGTRAPLFNALVLLRFKFPLSDTHLFFFSLSLSHKGEREERGAGGAWSEQQQLTAHHRHPVAFSHSHTHTCTHTQSEDCCIRHIHVDKNTPMQTVECTESSDSETSEAL